MMGFLLALISLFLFPWQIGAAAILAASVLMPAAGLALGLIADLVYYAPGAAFFPYFSLYGAACSALSVLVHRFVKTRIID